MPFYANEGVALSGHILAIPQGPGVPVYVRMARATAAMFCWDAPNFEILRSISGGGHETSSTTNTPSDPRLDEACMERHH